MNFRLRVATLPIALALYFVLFAGVAHAGSPLGQDITPPALVDVTFAPAQVDTSNGPATITVTIHATDDLSGIDMIQLNFNNLASGQHGMVFVNAFDALEHGSGSDRDGYFVATITLPRYSAYGEWKMTYFGLTDHVGNSGSSEAPPSPYAGTGWQPRYDSILFRNGPMPQAPTGARLFLPALAAF